MPGIPSCPSAGLELVAARAVSQPVDLAAGDLDVADQRSYGLALFPFRCSSSPEYASRLATLRGVGTVVTARNGCPAAHGAVNVSGTAGSPRITVALPVVAYGDAASWRA